MGWMDKVEQALRERPKSGPEPTAEEAYWDNTTVPGDDEWVWCTEDCPEDCMADHQGEE